MDDSSTPRPVPRPPSGPTGATDPTSSTAPDVDAAYGTDPADAGGGEDRPSVVADVEASLAAMSDLGAEEQVEAYRDLETSLRGSLRTAGGDL